MKTNTSSAAQQLAAMNDFQIVRFFQHFAAGLCESADLSLDQIVQGIPSEVTSLAPCAALMKLTPEEAARAIHPDEAPRVARGVLSQLAAAPQSSGAVEKALASFHDDKLAVDVILSLGLVGTVMLLTATTSVKGRVAGFTIDHRPLPAKQLGAMFKFLSGILTQSK
jgi:hypothetical protein